MSDAAVVALPYPGLRAFERAESRLFFGREGCVDAMIERLAATRFLGVLGASGSGKSSLVRTGLLDGLELGYFARAGSRWKIADMKPGGAPMRHLAEALVATGGVPSEQDVASTMALLESGPRALVEWSHVGGLKPGENLLVLVDQFEELFRYANYAAREEAEAFVGLLLESVRATNVPIYIVITMRSEFLGACALIPGLAEQINAGFYLTPRMAREECRQAIVNPAIIMDFEVEPRLTTRILNDMDRLAPWEKETSEAVRGQILSRRADQLPLMQHLLNRLWLRARAEAEATGDTGSLTLRVADYEAVGGLAGALDAHGGEVLAALSEDDRKAVPTVFRALVSGPDATNAVRRPSRLGAIADEIGPGGEATARRIIDAFRAPDCNFLQPPANVPLTRETLIDISHESLIRQWKALSGWLDDEARAAANWQRLRMAAELHERGEGDLLSGLNLATLAQWWESERVNPVWAERHGGGFERAAKFLEASREADAERVAGERDRRFKERRGRFVVGGLSLVVLPSIVVAGLTYASLRDARAELNNAERERAAIKTENARMVAQRSEIETLARASETREREAQSRLAEIQTRGAEAQVRLSAAEQARQTAESQRAAAATAAEEANRRVAATQQAAKDLMDRDEYFAIAMRAIDACRGNAANTVCDDINRDRPDAGSKPDTGSK